MNAPTIYCRLCDAPAVGIYHMPRGCICASDPVQALCAQHIQRATPIAGMWEIPVDRERLDESGAHEGL